LATQRKTNARIQQRRLLEASIHLQQAERIQAADYSGLRTILQDIRSVTKKGGYTLMRIHPIYIEYMT